VRARVGLCADADIRRPHGRRMTGRAGGTRCSECSKRCGCRCFWSSWSRSVHTRSSESATRSARTNRRRPAQAMVTIRSRSTRNTSHTRSRGRGGSVNVDYLDENGQPHRVDAAALPWSFTIVTTLPSMSANVVAQGDRGVNGLRCRVVVDGQLRDDRSSDEYQPFIYCLVKSV
jgi:hypothetical protein